MNAIASDCRDLFVRYGFNPGSVLFITSADLGSVSALAAVTTTLAPASGAISAMLLDTLLDYLANGHATWDVGSSMNGALTGLVAITAGCSTVTPWAAVVIGTVAGWVYLGGSKLMIKLRIDDAVDAVPVQ
jgi:Amt family ammonium transporter